MSAGEKICFEIVKAGGIRGLEEGPYSLPSQASFSLFFGFSAVDPGELAGHLPKRCNGNPGFFTKCLDKKLNREGSVIDYHLSSSGEVMYRVNGEEKGVFLSVGNKKTPLWGMIFLLGDMKIKLLHSS